MISVIKNSSALILLTSIFLGAATASADYRRAGGNRCLEQATDSELLNELSYRLRTGKPDQGFDNAVKFSFSCDSFGMMKALSTNLTTGASTVETLNINSRSECEQIMQVLNTKISQNRRTALIAASCDSFGTLRKVVIADNRARLDSINLNSRNECNIQAQALNQ